MNDKEIRAFLAWSQKFRANFKDGVGKIEELTLAEASLSIAENIATLFLEASEEFPKELDIVELIKSGTSVDQQTSVVIIEQNNRNRVANAMRSQCLAVHLKKVGELEATIEQLRVQLAGCGVEALGYGKNNEGEQVEKGDYGYSASLQDVRDLRERYQKLKEENAELKNQIVDAGEKHMEQIIEIKQLHQQIEGLRGALEKIVSLECTPYDCKCCPSEDIAKSALEEK